MTAFILKALVRGLLVLLLIPLVLALLLRSETVNRWLFERVESLEPRLQLEVGQGHLWRGWDFDRIVWADQGIEVVVEDIRFAWSPECLFGVRLCLDELDVERIRVTTEPTEEEPAERTAIALPDVRLPVGIQLERARFGSLYLNSEEPLLNDVVLSAHLRDSELVIHDFRGSGPDLDWQMAGDVRMVNGWPLKLNARVNLPPVQEQRWALDLRLAGSVAELELEAVSQGFLSGQLNAQLQPLDPKLPATLEWEGERLVVPVELPRELVVERSSLQARGDLETGYQVSGSAILPGEGGAIELALSTLVSQTELDDLDLKLFVVDQPVRQLTLTGDAAWADELVADVQLQVNQFPWQWLYPLDTGEIELEQASLNASLQGMQVQGNLEAALTGVAGQKVDLRLEAAGNPDQVDISSLALETQAGSVTGEASVNMTQGLTWQGNLLVDGLDPGAFVPDLRGDLNGRVTSTGSLVREQLELQADWDLEGTLRAQPLQLSGALQKQESAWQLNDLLLRQGQNRLTGSGTLGEEIDAQLDVRMPALATLWPGLSGALNGEITTSGSRAAPVIEASLQGDQLAYEQSSIADLSLQGRVTLSEATPGNLTVNAQNIRAGDTFLGDLDLTLRGDRAEHRLALQLDEGVANITARLQGALTGDRWQGVLGDAQIEYETLDWQLIDPARLTYRLDPAQLRMAEHCWRHDDARLCFQGEQRLLPDRQLDLVLTDFSLASLEEFLPEGFGWNAELDAAVEFRQAVGGEPVVSLNLTSAEGMVAITEAEQTMAFPYDLLQIDTEMEAGIARSRIQLVSDGFGTLDIRADIDDPGTRQSLTGEYSIQGLKLNILRPFVPQVDTLRGELNGQGRLAGTLREPEVVGRLSISDGQVSGPELPVSLEDLAVDVDINGQRAAVDGQWTSGDEGVGSLTGTVVWSPELDFDLSLEGSQLPVVVQPYADLRVSPDLQLSLANNQLRIRGQIAVPEGDITVRELPEQAVRQSPDVVIVGEEREETGPPLDVDARVQLVIGDQLRFSAFGLSGRLSGRIMVEEDMNATGDLNILDGRFRRYGQRLSLRRAQILFAGPISQPFLNIEAVRRVDDVVAGLRLTGRAEAPQTEVFSEPGMAQEQALAYLILGRPLGADGGDNNLVGQAALALGMAGGAPLARNIADTLGIDDFQLETEGSGISTQVVAAGYITDKLSLRYGVGVFDQANQLAVRYDLTRRLYLEAISGFASSLDFFYKIDF
ncbi:MAG: translocation/assembly module TamB [Pseudomonas sp.]|nr:translocation/assembly module TamB [Pseudomonas sp.]